MSDKILYTVAEAADAFGIAEAEVNRLIEHGEIVPVWIFGLCRIERDELRRYAKTLRSPEEIISRRRAHFCSDGGGRQKAKKSKR